MRNEPTAKDFKNAFFGAYQSRARFTSERWQQVWTDEWARFVLWRTAKPPEELEKSLLHQTAETLELDYWEDEPLKLDGAFYAKGVSSQYHFPFPIVVALEHENDHRGFGHEVIKLLSVRCRLKVGITYTLLFGGKNTPKERKSRIESIRQNIVKSFRQIREIVSEDPATEYLFLIGAEEAPYSLTWYPLDFSAGQDPSDRHFLIIDEGNVKSAVA